MPLSPRSVLLALSLSLPSLAAAPARYQVNASDLAGARLSVHATVPAGETLQMGRSRPGNVPPVDKGGWPALIKDLRVVDAAGEPVALLADGVRGWKLARSAPGPLSLDYTVDYTPFAAQGWLAQREAAYADAATFVAIGRSLFLHTPAQLESEVRFELPQGWSAYPPWTARDGGGFSVPNTDDLLENLVAFTSAPPDEVTASGFRLRTVATGWWQPARPEVRRVLEAALPRHVALLGFQGKADYTLVLLPEKDDAGESFRASFALTAEKPPARENAGTWGSLIAHELFHYWNGSRLKGADYPSSQWFQEGFTEYAANLAMVTGGLISEEAFRAVLADHVANAARLATPLDAPGTHKGPPLYSAGALVAFDWDLRLREASGGKRSLGDFLRALWRATGEGTRRYTWKDLSAALSATAPGEWEAFHQAHVHTLAPLPLAASFARAGLRLGEKDGAPTVEVEPKASAQARARWQQLVTGR